MPPTCKPLAAGKYHLLVTDSARARRSQSLEQYHLTTTQWIIVHDGFRGSKGLIFSCDSVSTSVHLTPAPRRALPTRTLTGSESELSLGSSSSHWPQSGGPPASPITARGGRSVARARLRRPGPGPRGRDRALAVTVTVTVSSTAAESPPAGAAPGRRPRSRRGHGASASACA